MITDEEKAWREAVINDFKSLKKDVKHLAGGISVISFTIFMILIQLWFKK